MIPKDKVVLLKQERTAMNWLISNFKKGIAGEKLITGFKPANVYPLAIARGLAAILDPNRKHISSQTRAFAIETLRYLNTKDDYMLRQCYQSLRIAVQNRSWARQSRGSIYNDLHGRAIRALHKACWLDPWEQWRIEQQYAEDGFAPLAWSLVREHTLASIAKGTEPRAALSRLARTLSIVHKLGFLEEAMQSVHAEFTPEMNDLFYECISEIMPKSPELRQAMQSTLTKLVDEDDFDENLRVW